VSDVRPDEIDAFRRDGVVRLRDKFSAEWLDGLRQAITDSLAAPGPNMVRHTSEPGVPGYYEDFWCWRESPTFTDFVRNSPAAPLAAQLLSAPSINLVMDNWFMREAGSTSRPPFHHDISYFDFVGSMCVLWLPLEPVSKEDGISFVRGSHTWGKHFMRVRFGDGHRTDGSGTVNGIDYEPVPDIEGNPDDYQLLSFDLDAGDCLFFDMRTLHGGVSTVVPSETVHRYTLRMTAPDGRIAYRGDWAAQERAMFEAAGYSNGDRLVGDFFPQLWPPVN
jgi:ectoine hydroxylase-related dioxygenase (phytanoyl-CoA dioxygenase family)